MTLKKRRLDILPSITNTETYGTGIYFKEVGKLALLEPAAEEQLTRRVREGDPAALDALISANLRFVISVAKKYQHMGMPLADLISEGNLGLIRAAEKFDPDKGFKFITFAVWWIRQYVIEAIQFQSRTIRLPGNQLELMVRGKRLTEQLEMQLGRRATDEELAPLLGISVGKLRESKWQTKQTLSYDMPLDEGEENLSSLLAAPGDNVLDELSSAETLHALRAMLARLPEREKAVLTLEYGLDDHYPHRIMDIAAALDLSVESVRKIRSNAMLLLRKQASLQKDWAHYYQKKNKLTI